MQPAAPPYQPLHDSHTMSVVHWQGTLTASWLFPLPAYTVPKPTGGSGQTGSCWWAYHAHKGGALNAESTVLGAMQYCSAQAPMSEAVTHTLSLCTARIVITRSFTRCPLQEGGHPRIRTVMPCPALHCEALHCNALPRTVMPCAVMHRRCSNNQTTW